MTRFYYGGQAVIEGVMMRGRSQVAVCVRRASGDLVNHSEVLPSSLYQRPFARLPLVRGLVMLWEMIILGTRMMLFSANVQVRPGNAEVISKRLLGGMIAFSLTFAVSIFFVLPLLLARAGGHLVHDSSLAANFAEGVLRLLLFVGYLTVLGRIPRMYRVFQYHGAEHKAINAYENGAPLTAASVQRFTTLHVRCGTAFLLWVVVVSIVVFGLLGHPPIIVGILARIILVPFIAAVSYEILRLGARFYHRKTVRLILKPGLALQKLTTREPTDDQVEVAIEALKPVLRADGVLDTGVDAVMATSIYRPHQATI